jgi:hypothetical protein
VPVLSPAAEDVLSPTCPCHDICCCVQYNHLHALSAKSLLTLDDLFEGRFTPALQQSGAVLSDVVTNFRSAHPAGGLWAQPTVPAKGPVVIGQATRHLVESVTRQLLLGAPGVEVQDNTTVTGLLLQQHRDQQGTEAAGIAQRIVGGYYCAEWCCLWVPG